MIAHPILAVVDVRFDDPARVPARVRVLQHVLDLVEQAHLIAAKEGLDIAVDLAQVRLVYRPSLVETIVKGGARG